MKVQTRVTETSRGITLRSNIRIMDSPFFRSFAALMLTIGSIGITGCGRGSSGAGTPSDSNIADAVKRRCEQGVPTTIKVPDRPVYPPSDNLMDYGNKDTISDLRVVKRGETFCRGSGKNSVEWFPVRVHIKGMRVANYSKWEHGEGKGFGEIVYAKSVNLPFEGEADFLIHFEPPDKTQVDAKPGKWVADPN